MAGTDRGGIGADSEHTLAKASVRETFGRTAQAYVASAQHARGEDLALLVDWLRPQPDWFALDVATGGGHVARTLAPQVRWLVAVDLTRPMLAAARAHNDRALGDHANITYAVADAEALPFLDATFDVVTCRIAAHHFPSPQRFVEEAARVLRPGGALLLIDNVAPDDGPLAQFLNTVEKRRDPSHGRCPSVAEWRAWLAAGGFVAEQSRLRKKSAGF